MSAAEELHNRGVRIEELRVRLAHMMDANKGMAAERDAARAQNAELVAALQNVMNQSESDLKSAHAEICKLQNVDPDKYDWPEWSPQANSLRWHAVLRVKFGLTAARHTQGSVE